MHSLLMEQLTKQHWARTVLGWETAWELLELLAWDLLSVLPNANLTVLNKAPSLGVISCIASANLRPLPVLLTTTNKYWQMIRK